MKIVERLKCRGYGTGALLRYEGSAIWFSEYYAKDATTGEGKQYRESTGTADVKKAWRFHEDKLRQIGNAKRGQGKVITPASQRVTVGALLDALVSNYTQRERRSMKSFKSHVTTVRAYFGDTCRAATVTTDAIDKFIEAQRDAKKKNATINRYTQVLKQAFRLALDDGRVVSVPKITRLPEDNARQGFFEREDFERLVTHLPEHLKDMARFGYLTGWRSNEIRTLTWADVDLPGGVIRLRGANAKNKSGRRIALDATLRALIARRERARLSERGVNDLVFHRDNGNPIQDFRFWWRTASVKAGLVHPEVDAVTGKKKIVPDFLFHDLRRTAVRNMIRAGVPQSVAMKITGHKTVSMFLRYDIGSDADLRAAAEAVGQRYEVVPAKN